MSTRIFAIAVLNISLVTTSSYVMEELLPTGERFFGPYPETAGNADNHCHKIFDHEDFEFGPAAEIARTLTHRTRQ